MRKEENGERCRTPCDYNYEEFMAYIFCNQKNFLQLC